MKAKSITLIRHAESLNNLLFANPSETYYITRKADPGLTERGVNQSIELKNYLKQNIHEYNFDLIISSPMFRAIETSKIVFSEHSGKKEI